MEASPAPPAGPGRLASLDAFRGVTIAAMILVNNPGSWDHVYAPLAHAEWHGWTPTDLIFPFFLFIVGVSMSFAVSSSKFTSLATRRQLALIGRRSATLIGLGLFMAAFPRFDLSSLRFPGVLQRIGLCYLLAAPVALYVRPSRIRYLVVGLLLGYWALMAWVPVPGVEDVVDHYSREANLASYVDRVVLGMHTWKPDYDPEGLLSTLPALATTLIGFLVGEHVRGERSRPHASSARLFVVGWILIVGGLAWSIWFPINKALWTSSYVLLTAGGAMQLLAFCYWIVDVRGWKHGVGPAIVFGRNAIAVFVLSGLVAKSLTLYRVGVNDQSVSLYAWIYRSVFASRLGELPGSLAFALATVFFWWSAMWLLHRRGIYLSV